MGCHEAYIDGDGRRWWGDARDKRPEEPWHTAARSVVYAYQVLENAKTIWEQGKAFEALSDAMSDMASWIPEYNYEVGLDSIGGEES
jgi:hypothetical protein